MLLRRVRALGTWYFAWVWLLGSSRGGKGEVEGMGKVSHGMGEVLDNEV